MKKALWVLLAMFLVGSGIHFLKHSDEYKTWVEYVMEIAGLICIRLYFFIFDHKIFKSNVK